MCLPWRKESEIKIALVEGAIDIITIIIANRKV